MSQIKILSAALAELDTIDHVISAERFERINSDNGLNFSIPLDDTTNTLITSTNVIGYGTDYFDIARYTKGQNGSGLPVAQVECEHISYRLNDPAFYKEWFTEIGTPTQILTKILEGTGFTVGTVDFTTSMTYSAQQAMSRRGLLMELIALLGGEGYFNGFTISILAQRGSTTPKDLTAYSNITVLSKSVDKRTLDALGNPTIAYQCAITNPVELALGDVVTLGYNLLDIDVTLRIVSISANPYDTSEIDIEVGNYTNALEDDMYRIETSMVAKGSTYYGARISPENGFESIRNDKMARTVMNADQFAMQTGDGTGSNWTNKLYFDPVTSKYVFDGTLSATMIEALEAEFDITISQTVIVNQLSAQKGNIAELTVDQIDTSDFVQRYLDSDLSPVGYWKGYDQHIEFYEAVIPEGDVYYTQVKNRNNEDIYWIDETHTGTTIEITDFPVTRYVYNGDDTAGVVKLKIFHDIDPTTGYATPKIIWGQGSGVGDNGKAYQMKSVVGFQQQYLATGAGSLPAGTEVTIDLTDNGAIISNMQYKITGVKYTSFGDSITYQNLWQPHVIDFFKLTHTNCGVGSTKIAGATNVSFPCFWEGSRLTAVKVSNPDFLTILGGANDWAGNIAIGTDAEFTKSISTKDKTTFKGAYSFIVEDLLTWKPELVIMLLSTTWGDDEASNTLGLTNRDYAKATKEVAWFYGLPFVDTRGEMGLNKLTKTLLLSDSVHPNAVGAKRIANLVIEKLKTIPYEISTSEINSVYLYNLGIEGLSWSLGVNQKTSGTITISKNSDHLYMYAIIPTTGGANIGYSTDSKLDLSGISTLFIDVEVTITGAYGTFLVGLDPNSRSDINNYYTDLIVYTSSSGRQVYQIDVTNFTDSRYFKFFAGASAGSSCTLKVFKVWCEA